MPPAIRFPDDSGYELTSCQDEWDVQPGSLAAHTALRAGVHHACLNVQAHSSKALTTTDVRAPHWRETPSIQVDATDLFKALALPFGELAREPAWIRGAACDIHEGRPWFDAAGWT